MIKKLFIWIFILTYLFGCSPKNNLDNETLENKIKNPDEIYILAMKLFDQKNFTLADEEFTKLIQLYPLSNEAIQAEIMSGFIAYLQMDYDTSVNKFNKIIKKYPSHKNLDYVYYMIAMCNYEQITHHELDGQFNEITLNAFNQVLLRFPESQYAKDSRQKIILVKSNKAAKHMEIGRFYLKEKKYTAALNRFKIVIEDYGMTKFTPEALHRMVESYYEIGMYDEATNTASILGHNYPKSKWYRHSYNLIKNIDEKSTFFEKINKIF